MPCGLSTRMLTGVSMPTTFIGSAVIAGGCEDTYNATWRAEDDQQRQNRNQ